MSEHIYLFDTCFYTKSLDVGLTLSFDAEVFTLITGSPLDLSITTVLSVPRLAREKKRAKKKGTKDIQQFLQDSKL